MSACPKDTELREMAAEAEAQGRTIVPVHRDTLRAMADRLANAQAARRALIAYLRGVLNQLESQP